MAEYHPLPVHYIIVYLISGHYLSGLLVATYFTDLSRTSYANSCDRELERESIQAE